MLGRELNGYWRFIVVIDLRGIKDLDFTHRAKTYDLLSPSSSSHLQEHREGQRKTGLTRRGAAVRTLRNATIKLC